MRRVSSPLRSFGSPAPRLRSGVFRTAVFRPLGSRNAAARVPSWATLGLAWLSVLVLAGAPLGCSQYRMVRYAGGFGDVQRVAIEPLSNRSFEPGVERLVTDALRREFTRRGGVQVVRQAASADLVLSGAVLPLTTRSRSFSSVELALEFEVELPVRLVARRPDGTELTFDNTSLRDWELYLASADVEVERKNREEALRRLSQLIAGRVHDALAERLTAAR